MPTREEIEAMRAQVRKDREIVQQAQTHLSQSEQRLAKAEHDCHHNDTTTYEFEEIIEPERMDPWGGLQSRRATGTYRKVAVKTCQRCGRIQRIVPPI